MIVLSLAVVTGPKPLPPPPLAASDIHWPGDFAKLVNTSAMYLGDAVARSMDNIPSSQISHGSTIDQNMSEPCWPLASAVSHNIFAIDCACPRVELFALPARPARAE